MRHPVLKVPWFRGGSAEFSFDRYNLSSSAAVGHVELISLYHNVKGIRFAILIGTEKEIARKFGFMAVRFQQKLGDRYT